jgi:murein DD-endopeptidase MepM/ murein hydrolase activator NlpD
MGDHPTGTGGNATPPAGKRVARHAAEQSLGQPYSGRRVARPAPTAPAAPIAPAADAAVILPAPGRRRRTDVVPSTSADAPSLAPLREVTPFAPRPVEGRRLAPATPFEVSPFDVSLVSGLPPVDVAPLAQAPVLAAPIEATPCEPAPVVEPIALEPLLLETLSAEAAEAHRVEPLPIEPVPAAPVAVEPVEEPVRAALPLRVEPLVVEDVMAHLATTVDLSALTPLEEKPVAQQPITVEPRPQHRVAAPPRAPGRRVSRRRSRIPLPTSPVLIGVAILGISAAGALQAVNPGLAGTTGSHHLAPASALSGTSAIGTASVLGGRSAVVSRSSDRLVASGSSLQAAADAQAKQRAETLSGFASQAEKQAQKIKLHQWVLPVAAGAYHLTARFGDYSSLWSNFHTGLDFAAPTGTSIMAVAGGTITDVGYSGAFGNRTIETLADGTELWYCHQNEFGTSVGATVRPGQVIGYVGSTGNVTGPHLHLEVHPGGGDAVDPYTALEVHGLQP